MFRETYEKSYKQPPPEHFPNTSYSRGRTYSQGQWNGVVDEHGYVSPDCVLFRGQTMRIDHVESILDEEMRLDILHVILGFGRNTATKIFGGLIPRYLGDAAEANEVVVAPIEVQTTSVLPENVVIGGTSATTDEVLPCAATAGMFATSAVDEIRDQKQFGVVIQFSSARQQTSMTPALDALPDDAFRVLRWLAGVRNRSPKIISEVAGGVGMTSRAVGPLLSQLRQAGLITRERNQATSFMQYHAKSNVTITPDEDAAA